MKKKNNFNDSIIKQFENMTAVLETQSKLIGMLTNQVNFLMNNDKESVCVYLDLSKVSIVNNFKAKYIFNNELRDVELYDTVAYPSFKVIDNTEYYAVIESRSFGSVLYHKLDKKNGVAVDITDEYSKLAEIKNDENKENAKKKKTPTKKAKDGK